MMEFLTRLKNIGKLYYSISDLIKVTGLARDSLYVALSRYVKKKVIIRLTAGIYILPEQYDRLETIANELYSPSYLSFESALSRYGIISQVPYSLTFATTRKSLRRSLAETHVEYRSIKAQLFTGYENNGSIFIATPEKAILDSLYLVSFGKSMTQLKNPGLKEVNIQKMKKLARIYPKRTQELMYRFLKNFNV
jgi:predicted transcriptional regulator of viral defense system